ncbi:hypothetical protein GALMADRAFT_74443, partial [Galerina marginata CBS 339.88]
MKSAGLHFQLLQNSVDVLTPMALSMEKMNIIERSFRYEMCCSLVKVFDWYSHQGPAIAQRFMLMHRRHGYSYLEKEAPQFAELVDHIVQYVYSRIVTKFEPVDGQPTKIQNKRSKFTNNRPLLPPVFGPNLHGNNVSSLPANLYGLIMATKERAQGTRIKLPIIADAQVQHNPDALYAASAWCLQELWSKEIIIPKLCQMDRFHSGGRTTVFDDTLI